MPDDVAAASLLDTGILGWRETREAGDEETGPATLQAVLRALSAMARNSRRQEADVESALFAAGLSLPPAQRDAALSRLHEAGAIERIIPLSDGGVLVAVTAAGMGRAARTP